MDELHELREKLCNELKGYGKREMSTGSLEVIDKLAHAIKNIDKIMSYHEGYSEMRRSRDDGMIHELKDLIKRMESM